MWGWREERGWLDILGRLPPNFLLLLWPNLKVLFLVLFFLTTPISATISPHECFNLVFPLCSSVCSKFQAQWQYFCLADLFWFCFFLFLSMFPIIIGVKKIDMCLVHHLDPLPTQHSLSLSFFFLLSLLAMPVVCRSSLARDRTRTTAETWNTAVTKLSLNHKATWELLAISLFTLPPRLVPPAPLHQVLPVCLIPLLWLTGEPGPILPYHGHELPWSGTQASTLYIADLPMTW